MTECMNVFRASKENPCYNKYIFLFKEKSI